VKDAELLKKITIKDFDSFVNHDKFFDESVDKMFGKSLFQMFDERWRSMRHSLSPIFTSSKMKMMFGILSECAEEFIENIDNVNGDKIIVDVKEKFSRYTLNGITTAALGFKGDCIKNKDSFIYNMAMDIAKPSTKTNLKILLAIICKPLYVFFGLQVFPEKYKKFFESSIVDVMNERDEKGTFRPDVVQLLLQMKKGQLDNREKSDDKDLANFSANVEYDVGGSKTKLIWDKEDFMAQGLIELSL
jgi:cytochrome P450 family 9